MFRRAGHQSRTFFRTFFREFRQMHSTLVLFSREPSSYREHENLRKRSISFHSLTKLFLRRKREQSLEVFRVAWQKAKTKRKKGRSVPAFLSIPKQYSYILRTTGCIRVENCQKGFWRDIGFLLGLMFSARVYFFPSGKPEGLDNRSRSRAFSLI